MQIKTIQNIDSYWQDKKMDSWEKFPFTFSSEYLNFLKKKGEMPFYVEIEADGELWGFPFSVRKGKLLQFGQYLFTPLNLRNGEKPTYELEKELLDSWNEYIRKNKVCDNIRASHNFIISQQVPEKSKGIPFGSYQLSLIDKDSELLMKGFHSKHRNVIRNAMKKETEIREGEACLDDFYQLYSDTMVRNNMYCESKEEFESLYNHLKDKYIYTAAIYYEGRPQGALMLLYSQYAAYYVYGASAGKVEVTGAINYLHFHAMQRMIEKKVKIYDFVGARLSDVSGSKAEGIQKFKKRFGADLLEGVVWKADINKVKCELFNKMLQAKGALKGKSIPKDIIDQELEKQTN